MQDLPGLRSGSIERCRRREPVVSVMPTFAEAALADGVDEVIFENPLSKRGAVVDEVACTLGFGAVEGCQVWMGNSGASLDGVDAGLEFCGDLLRLRGSEHALQDDAAAFLPVLEHFIQRCIDGHFRELESIRYGDLWDICWDSPHFKFLGRVRMDVLMVETMGVVNLTSIY